MLSAIAGEILSVKSKEKKPGQKSCIPMSETGTRFLMKSYFQDNKQDKWKK